jgi:hypothetical protein
VVIENVVRGDTKGSVSTVDAKFELLKRGTYDDMRLERFTADASAPLSLYEARKCIAHCESPGGRSVRPRILGQSRRRDAAGRGLSAT